jgi:hypothetical protein
MSKYCITDNNTECSCRCEKYQKVLKYGSKICINCKHKENDLMRWDEIIRGVKY